MRNIFAQQISPPFSTPSAYLFSFSLFCHWHDKNVFEYLFLWMFYWGIWWKEMCNVKSLLKSWNLAKIKQSCKDNVLKNLAKFTEKNSVSECQTFQAGVLRPYSKETLAQVVSYKFCEIFKNISFTEKLRNTVSVNGPGESTTLTLNYFWRNYFWNISF